MTDSMFPKPSKEMAKVRHDAAPAIDDAWKAFGRAVFAEGQLSKKVKQLIAVAVAHVTQCPYCIRGHVEAAKREGATVEELMEAIWVAAEMRAGGAFAHAYVALDAFGVGHPHPEPAG